MKLNTITNSDCLKYLKKLPDKSVDLVLTDPPYFIGFDGGKGTSGLGIQFGTSSNKTVVNIKSNGLIL